MLIKPQADHGSYRTDYSTLDIDYIKFRSYKNKRTAELIHFLLYIIDKL